MRDRMGAAFVGIKISLWCIKVQECIKLMASQELYFSLVLPNN